MALDSKYISSLELESYFVNKDTGAPLAGGLVYFYEDDNRNNGKLVYQLVQDVASGDYSYEALPNPITLSGVGTFQNAGGDNVAVYYYPFDEFGNQQLYYIVVQDSGGNEQFTREAWPFPSNTGGGTASTLYVGLNNQLINPQFADVFFIGTTLTITISGAGTTTYNIAPGWVLSITATGASTVTVAQTPIAGEDALPNNPPYTLDITPGANISAIQLRQRLNHNPDWAAPQTDGVMGYLSGSIMVGDATEFSMQYLPSSGNPAQNIIAQTTNNTGQYVTYSGTVQLDAADNAQTGAVGYVDILINIYNLATASSISNTQAIPLQSNITGVLYDQAPVNRQRAYYQDLINTTGGISNFNTGRLTLTTGVPVTTANVTAATTIYYTPYKGNGIWLYLNSVWTFFAYSEISIAIPAVANQMYDVFATVSTGTTVVLTLTAWTNDTTRATALTTQNGVYVLTGATNKRYLGSFRTRTAGQANDTVAFRHLYNYYNRVSKPLDVTDATASWTYTNPAFQQANNNAANQVDVVQGVIEDCITLTLDAGWNNSVVGGGTGVSNGIGVDNLTPVNRNRQQNANANQVGVNVVTFFEFPTTVGRHYYTWLEASDASGTTTWYGTAFSDNFGLAGFCYV